MKTALIVICGATATGKSRLALALAQKIGSVILSADSRQIYQGFDIGTAKPSITEQQLVPHYLIDICEPTQRLTLADYQTQAQDLIEQPHSSPPLLVGGTGLYIGGIVKGLITPAVAPQPQLRQQLQSLGQRQLHQMLAQVDPTAARKIHVNDQLRTLRALEVYYVTGKPISTQQGASPPDYPILQIGLYCQPETLQQRITRRTQQMLDQGLVEEVKGLVQQYGEELPLLKTLGYGEIVLYLQGRLSLAEAQNDIILHTKQFAKRQRTWFRKNPDIIWFDRDESGLMSNVLGAIEDFIALKI